MWTSAGLTKGNEELPKTIEMYQEAIKRDGQYALAFLRLAILYGRNNSASAFPSFDKAEALYRMQNNYESVAEVLFQRGSLYDKLDKTEDARQQLEEALVFTRNMGNQYQEIKTLIQLSSVHTSARKPDEAKRIAQDAVKMSRANGMETLTALALNELGNAFYASGEAAEAEKYLNDALETAQRHHGPRNEARARLSLGSLFIYQRKPDQALPYIEQALRFFQDKGYGRETVQTLTLMSYYKQLKGDVEGALASFQQQLEAALQYGEPTQIARAHDGCGVALSGMEQYPRRCPISA